MVNAEDDSYKSTLKAQLDALFNADNPENTVFDGVTTNPRLTSNVLNLISDEVNLQ